MAASANNHLSGPDRPRDGGPPDREEVLRLIGRAREVESGFTARMARAHPPDAQREGLARVALRLKSSVIRPLVTALAKVSAGNVTESRPETAQSAITDTQSAADALEGHVWQLAQEATVLRARRGQPTEIQEAAAALQD